MTVRALAGSGGAADRQGPALLLGGLAIAQENVKGVSQRAAHADPPARPP